MLSRLQANVRRWQHVAGLNPPEHPAEEDIARRLDQPLADNDALPVILVLTLLCVRFKNRAFGL